MDRKVRTMKKAKLTLVACIVALTMGMMALSGCAADDSAKPAEQQGQETQSYAPISVAYLNKAGYEDIIVGDKQGYFAEAGPEVTLHAVTGSGQQSVEALLAGSVDIAATGQGPVADAIKQYGDDIVILACSNCYTGGQVLLAGPGMTGDAQIVAYDKTKDNKDEVRTSFESAAQAKGAAIKVGVQKGATTESELKAWLKAMGVTFNDFGIEGDGVVTLVDVKANTLPTTLATGTDIDMMAASQPYPDTALSQIPGTYRVGTNADIDSYSLACLITTKDVYAEKEASIKAFLEAEAKTVAFMNEQPDAAMKICADSIGTDMDSVKAAFDIADFKIGMTSQMFDTLQKTCAKKGVEITVDQLKEQTPLLTWMEATLS